MLGYELKDIETMQAAISLAMKNLPNKVSFNVVRSELARANDFFDGLWAEGYFD